MTFKRKAGFSLIELMAVIAIIGILITLVSPQISKARLRGKLTQQAVKARSIVEAVTAKAGGSRFSQGWPQAGEYGSSTAFLTALVEEGYLDVDYAWFAGPGMTPARDKDDFNDANNAWCILLNVNDMTPGNTPVVFLRNVDPSGNVDAAALPFGNKGFAFATKNGEAVSVEQGELNGNDFQYIFKFPDGVDTSCLKPKAE